MATLYPPALVGDFLLLFLCYKATESWEVDWQVGALGLLAFWMGISKVLKILGHFLRYPADVFLLPVSIAFGYCHGFIKVQACLSLNVVSLKIRRHRSVLLQLLIKAGTLALTTGYTGWRC